LDDFFILIFVLVIHLDSYWDKRPFLKRKLSTKLAHQDVQLIILLLFQVLNCKSNSFYNVKSSFY